MSPGRLPEGKASLVSPISMFGFFEKSEIVKSLSEECSTLELAKLLGRDHRTINVSLQILQRVARKVWRKKDAN